MADAEALDDVVAQREINGTVIGDLLLSRRKIGMN
jgi:hypothetical protein